MSHKVVFIFRRDLRWTDNVGLTHAYQYVKQHSDHVLYPIFIFNGQQIEPKKNPYFSYNSLRFMIECIFDLKPFLNTYHVEHSDIDALTKISNISAVFFNRDYTPFARKRDEEIIEWCKKKDIHVHGEWNEYGLINIPDMPKPYKVYGAFLQAHLKTDVPTPQHNEAQIKSVMKHASHHARKDLCTYYQNRENDVAAMVGGRANALKRIQMIQQGGFDKYEHNREYPSLMLTDVQSTTMLSGHLKYGTVSIREVYHTLKSRKAAGAKVIRELFWRAFYEQIVYHFPHTLEGQLDKSKHYNSALNHFNNQTRWSRNNEAERAIMSGTTGIPIVDAGVRELLATGYMHNRLRMVVCMLACRILKMDWRVFERWFASHLIDYYPAVNRMSWEWAVTYRFTLNPWVQQVKFDKDAIFIKHWVPELQDVPPNHIHAWYDQHKNYAGKVKYPKPIHGRKVNT